MVAAGPALVVFVVAPAVHVDRVQVVFEGFGAEPLQIAVDDEKQHGFLFLGRGYHSLAVAVEADFLAVEGTVEFCSAALLVEVEFVEFAHEGTAADLFVVADVAG